MDTSYLVLLALCVASNWSFLDATGDSDSMRFANYYGDHMVLQREPVSAVVWGYVNSCDSTISVDMDGKKVTVTQSPAGGRTASGCRWKASLPATPAGGPHTVTASSDKYGSAILSDVLFGDVWICSGQSNMQFTVPQAYNASEEGQKAANYPSIRVFTAQLVSSDTPTDELLGIMQQWAVASPASINASAWGYFSATCWFFGKNLFDSIGIPIGLLATSWGGTRIEAWSSPDALAKCSSRRNHHEEKRFIGPNPNNPSVLWNSMIHPFLPMPIYGAVWYQGEANAGDAAKYTCSFPAMITDWRMKWHEATSGQTNTVFPFGFVQLAPNGNSNQTSTGFPDLRWAQTAGQGWVPNSHMDRVFMAVTIDLGDPTSPFGSVHPRDKEDVGKRLALGALAIAYGNRTAENIYFSDPIPSKAVLSNVGKSDMPVSAEISYQMTTEALVMRSPYGFELGCNVQSSSDIQWVEGTLKRTDGTSLAFVEFPQCPGAYRPFAVRYCWKEDPCSFMQCPLYGGPAMLPAPPYMIDVTSQ